LHLGARLEWISVGTALAVFVAGMLVVAFVCRGEGSEEQTPWLMVGLLALSLSIAPVSWTHYQLMQFPGVAMLLVAALRRHYWGIALGTAVLFGLVYQLPQYFLIAYHDAQNGWTTAS